ncbi:accessory Sec system protein Asp2 [Staphylococcus aureus]
MGSLCALYYGAQLNPQAIIVGKPLVNIGTIAEHMRLLRPVRVRYSIRRPGV